jgi:endonuclease G
MKPMSQEANTLRHIKGCRKFIRNKHSLSMHRYRVFHMAPAGDMRTPEAMAQSFSLANMVPQASEHNRGAWAKTVENPTRKYASRATGDVYVITGPVFVSTIAQSPSIGSGQVHVPKYLFKLVYDQSKNRAWAYWHLNDDATHGSKPISYGELVRRTGIEFLPGVSPGE